MLKDAERFWEIVRTPEAILARLTDVPGEARKYAGTDFFAATRAVVLTLCSSTRSGSAASTVLQHSCARCSGMTGWSMPSLRSDPVRVLRYLGRYTHRVAISNRRLLSFDGHHVRFRWKDYAHGNKQRIMIGPTWR